MKVLKRRDAENTENSQRNIILIGFRGTGKSTIAKLLGKILNRKVFSIDSIVEKNAEENISSIVKTKGWKYFRDLESEVLKEVTQENNIIIDCGGGIVLRKKNRNLLKKNNALIVLLEADVDSIKKRISKDDSINVEAGV